MTLCTLSDQHFGHCIFDLAAYWSDEKGEATISSSIDISIAVATEKVFLPTPKLF